MICERPIEIHGAKFGCYTCIPCRINRRRQWVARLILESGYHERQAFVTLTYNEENVPEDYSLNRDHLRLYLKNIRKVSKVRYFAVGEYGDRFQRPHYHLIQFGEDDPGIIQRAWCNSKSKDRGNVFVGTVEAKSIQYVCSYVIKGMTNKDHPGLLGRKPEFVTMSNRPGIGAQALEQLVKVQRSATHLNERKEILSEFRLGKKLLPLGSYLRKRISVQCSDVLPERTPTRVLLEREVRREYDVHSNGDNARRVQGAKRAYREVLKIRRRFQF